MVYYNNLILCRMAKRINLIGKQFGRLQVVGIAENKGKNTAWTCMCECGVVKSYLTYNLTSGKSQSCGCARVESMSKKFTTHGKSKTRLYQIYKGMKQRCLNENSPAYNYYGGKGVSIHKDWLSNFMSFYKWSYNNGYKEGLSIDRIDPNGNYEPNNCRWVESQQQQNNKLNSFFITIDGSRKTLAEWAKINKANKQTLYSQFYRMFDTLNIINSSHIELTINTNKNAV